MPRHRLLALLGVLTLAACQLTQPFGNSSSPPPAALPGGTIEVTPLDAPSQAEVAALDPAPEEGPEVEPAAVPPDAAPKAVEQVPPSQVPDAPAVAPEAPTPTPSAPKSEAQRRCERQGGNWASNSNTALKTCVKSTGDGGKQCTRKTDCKGECLARSNTCAPIAPLLGCNDVLLSDGTRTTLCID